METKNVIAIYFDGTWNTVEYPDGYSNVKKIKDYVGEIQTFGNLKTIIHPIYSEGPGTRPQTKILGGLFAYDLPAILEEAYTWLAKLYYKLAKQAHAPEIYLFGFSRGSYLAHVFSWILNDVGITSNYPLIPSLIDSYMKKNPKKMEQLKKEIDLKEVFMPVVRMMGLWDMVRAPVDRYRHFYEGERAPIVQSIYHAMSLDENRLMFPVLKYKGDDTKVEQCWFSGVHSDIGGGYKDTVLSDITLNWMIRNAEKEGLIIRGTSAADEATQNSEAFLQMEKHNESGLLNQIATWGGRKRHCEGEHVDESVYRRMKQDHSYHPFAKNFPDKKADYV